MSDEKKNKYIVFGEKGAYSDHREWPVAVHDDHESAYEHEKLANQYSKLLEFKGWNYPAMYRAEKAGDKAHAPNKLNPYDPAWEHGANYKVYEVPALNAGGSLQSVSHPVKRAPGTGQCSCCAYIDQGYDDAASGLVEDHWPHYEDRRVSRRNVLCDGVGKPPRRAEDEDFESWRRAEYPYY